VIEARDLIAVDFQGTSDPYVRVNYGNLKRRTKVRILMMVMTVVSCHDTGDGYVTIILSFLISLGGH